MLFTLRRGLDVSCKLIAVKEKIPRLPAGQLGRAVCSTISACFHRAISQFSRALPALNLGASDLTREVACFDRLAICQHIGHSFFQLVIEGPSDAIL